jgi:hypothetical protein
MLDQPDDLTLIRLTEVLRRPEKVPNDCGVYFIFFDGGLRLLEACGYFDLGGRRPLSSRGRHHLYTGASRHLRQRLRDHLRTDLTVSELRLSLLTLQQQFRAISRTKTPFCHVRGEKTLTQWLSANAYFAFEEYAYNWHFLREQELVHSFPSALNIAYQRANPFARKLSEWRQSTFPRAGRSRRLAVRYK